MKLFLKRLTLLLWIWSMPLMAFAADPAEKKLFNPLGTTSIQAVIARLIKALLGLSGSIALLMFVWGGFLWLSSRGETKQIEKGKETIKWATFGLVIIFTAYILVGAIIGALIKGTAVEAPS